MQRHAGRRAGVVSVALSGLAVMGCAMGQWSTADALVRPGGPVFFAVSRKESHGSQHSWKQGGSIPTAEVSETRFRAIDVRTCRVVRTVTVAGPARVLAWDAKGDELWFVTPGDGTLGLDPVVARSLSGATINLPTGTPGTVGGTPGRPLWTFRDDGRGLVHIWDVRARAISSLPSRPGPFGARADEDRVVAVLSADTRDAATLVVMPRAPGIDLAKSSRAVVTAPGLRPASGWLFDDAVALQAGNNLVSFDLRTGASLHTLPLSGNGWRIMGSAHPTIVSLAAASASGAGSCFGELDVRDVATGAQRRLALPSCVTGFMWTPEDDTSALVLTGSRDGHAEHWAVQTGPRPAIVPIGSSIDQHVEVAGSSLFYTEGQLGPRPLMVADLSTGTRRAATATLASIEDFRADPSSGSVIIKSASGLLAYRIAAGKLDACDGD